MSKNKKAKESIADKTFNQEEMITSFSKKRLAVIVIILILLVGVVVVSALYDSYVSAIGLVAFIIYVAIITFAQKTSDYSFEFVEGQGLKEFKTFYRGKELELDYSLDRKGYFSWSNPKREINCINYADGSRINKYITCYRILNYINSFMEQNGLNADKI